MLVSERLEAFRGGSADGPHKATLRCSLFSKLFLKAFIHHELKVATHIPEVLILELEHIDALNGHVKTATTATLRIICSCVCRIIGHYASLFVRQLIYLLILFNAL